VCDAIAAGNDAVLPMHSRRRVQSLTICIQSLPQSNDMVKIAAQLGKSASGESIRDLPQIVLFSVRFDRKMGELSKKFSDEMSV
jgi:hypothetical protein